MVELQPVGRRIFAEPIREVEKIGLIYLPDEAKQKSYQAKVIALGDKWDIPEVSIGTVIITNRYGGHEMVIDKKKVNIYEEWDIIGVINE